MKMLGFLILFRFYSFLLYVYESLPECISVYRVCGWCPWRPGKNFESPETGVRDSCKLERWLSSKNIETRGGDAYL